MRTKIALLLGALTLGLVGLVATPAQAAIVPNAPTNCQAVLDFLGTGVNITWGTPYNNGGSTITAYKVRRKSNTTPTVSLGSSARSYHWTTTFARNETFQVQAVNSVGGSEWCDAPLGQPSRPLLPYTAASWLRTTTLGLTPNATKTAAMISYITAHDPHQSPNLQGLGSGGGGGWGTSWGGVATCSDPVWKIGTGTVQPQNAFLTTTGFHASQQMVDDINNAAAQGGTDLPFEVIDTCGNATFPDGFVVKGAQAQPVAGTNTINVGYAGAYSLVSNGLDGRVSGSNDTNNWTSRGVIAGSSTIRQDQLSYAVANNNDLGQRLEIFWWETDSAAGVVSPPMYSAEQNRFGWGAEGQLIGIDKAYNASNCTNAAAAAVVRTLQNYGAYIGDNAGAGGTSLKMEQDHGQWTSLGVTQRSLDTCAGLDWNDFVAY